MTNTFINIGNLISGFYRGDILITDNDEYVDHYRAEFDLNKIPYTVINYPIDVISSDEYHAEYHEDLPDTLTKLNIFVNKLYGTKTENPNLRTSAS